MCVCVNNLTHMNYSNLISIENLFQAWNEFRKGKRKKLDVQVFERNLEDNLFELQHQLKVKYYLRYADDFILLSCSNDSNQWIKQVVCFLKDNLKLELHPKKIILRRLRWGIDSLGYIVLPHYILPRTKTKRRMFKKLTQKRGSQNFSQSLQSYLGYLKHVSSFKLQQEIYQKFI